MGATSNTGGLRQYCSLFSSVSFVGSSVTTFPPTVDLVNTIIKTPTLAGTVGVNTLSGGETFSVTVNGNVYTTANGLIIAGTLWSLPVATPLLNGVYDIRAVRTTSGLGIPDQTNGELVINNSPVLNDTPLTLTVGEDAGLPIGVVGSLISTFTGGITDVDAGALKGIAIIGADESNGTWYYTIDVGTNWIGLNQFNGTVSATNALLLSDNTNARLYFSPLTNYNGTQVGALTIRAWDRTNGTTGTKVNTTIIGGATAFSSNTDVIDVTVNPVNDAPARISGTVSNLTISEDAAITSLGLGTVSYGPGGGANEASQTLTYAVTIVPSASLGSITLVDSITVVTSSTNYTLSQIQGMKFLCTANSNGVGTFSYSVTDNGGTANGGVNTLIESLNITVNSLNDAPVLANTALSFTITEDAGVPIGAVGSLVSSFTIGITDVDVGAVKGIAITAINETNGTWYYTTNGGSSWAIVGGVSNSQSLLLADNVSTRLYFAPLSNYSGTQSGALTLCAWDQTSGTAGTKVTTAINGGATAFSNTTAQIVTIISAVGDAPVGTAKTITIPVSVNYTYTISDFGFTDPIDNPANNFSGLFVTTLNATYNGLRLNGVIVSSGATISKANIAAGLFQYIAEVSNVSRVWTFKVNDDSPNGISQDLTARNMTMSSNQGANNAPVLTPASPTLNSINEDQTPNNGQTVASFMGAISDADGVSTNLGIAISTATAGTVGGTWQYSLDDGTSWISFPAVTSSASLLLRSTDFIRYFPPSNAFGTGGTITYRAWDQTSGFAGNTFSTTKNGGSTAFSFVQNITSPIIVNPVNDAPVIANTSVLNYTENALATIINTNIIVSDLDNVALASGTVGITGNFSTGQDMLSFTNVPAMMGNIIGIYVNGTGVMTLTSTSATATLSQWQAALRAVKYFNTSNNPSTLLRTVSFRVNDGVANSNIVSSNINITSVPSPIVTCGGPYGSLCSNDNAITLNGVPVGGTWSGIGIIGNTFNPGAGTQALTYSYANAFGSDSCTVTLVVNAAPAPVISGSLSFCSGSSTTLDAGFYSAFNWSTGATTQTISVASAGVFTVTVSNSIGCHGTISATTSINVCTITITLKTFIEGLYTSNSLMQAVIDPINYPTLYDSITVELHDSASSYIFVQRVTGAINTNGIGQFVFPNSVLGESFYIVVRHRNSVETWSKNPVLFDGASVNYDFSAP